MIKTIYIKLLEEGAIAYRPTQAEEVEPGLYKVLPTENYDPEDEIWEFLPGTIVRCEVKTLRAREAHARLVAVEKA